MAITRNDEAIYLFLQDKNYIVYPDGSIWTTRASATYPKNTLKKLKGTKVTGYARIVYKVNKKRKFLLVSRIVYAKFGNERLKPLFVINHKDGNKLNNHIDNLEQITGADNQRHSYRVLGQKAVNNFKYKINLDIAKAIRADKKLGMRTTDLTKKYKLSRGTIWMVVNYKTWPDLRN